MCYVTGTRLALKLWIEVLHHPDVRLDIVGENRTYPFVDIAGLLAESSAGAAITWHQYVTDRQLHALYRAARAFVFLSDYEGLGLTPLEALAAHVPPVLLDTAVARESYGDAAFYVPDHDPMQLAVQLERVLYDERRRRAIPDSRLRRLPG